jgi:hypothetical protein
MRALPFETSVERIAGLVFRGLGRPGYRSLSFFLSFGAVSFSNVGFLVVAHRTWPTMIASLRMSSRDEHQSDENADTPFENSKRHLAEPESGESIRLRTLGDEVCAPGAADEATQTGVDEPDFEVSPGYKGWINLVGVSRVTYAKSPVDI